MASEVVLKVENVGKRYEIYEAPHQRLLQTLLRGRRQFYKEFWALKDVSFEVKKGECLGIIGRNGCGKSTLLQIIAGTLAPTIGRVSVNGKVAALLELGSGFNPEFTGRENVYMNGAIMGLSRAEMDKKFDEIAAFADIGEFIDQPVKIYSAGMMVRLAFAVQARIDASIVIIDEALAVGDIFFRQKCYTRLEQLKNSGAAILLVSHSMPDIEQHCERAILLNDGVPRFIGAATEATKHYYLLHQAQSTAAAAPHPIADANESLPTKYSPLIPRPPVGAFIDISDKPQVTNGQACCIGLAICDTNNQPCHSFRQGDRAVFYYEFELKENIGIPICGLVLSNERGIIVHGKHSWQYGVEAFPSLGIGSKIVCRQEIGLELAQGDYVLEVGLAAVSEKTWQNQKYISHEDLSVNHVRICHIANAGMFSVGLAQQNGVSVLTHHGIANLPGKMEMASVPRSSYEPKHKGCPS